MSESSTTRSGHHPSRASDDAHGLTAPVAHGLPTLPALLGLRALAATSIILFHLHHLLSLPLPPGCGMVGSHFGLGVQMFFVLSAFSLCYSTAGSVSREGWLRDYMIKRIFRIAPLFYAALAAWVLIFWSRGVLPNPYTLVLNLSFTFGLVPGRHESLVAAGWTIGVEMLFYCVFPLALVAVRTLRSALVLLVVTAAISVAGRHALTADGEVLDGYGGLSIVTSLPLLGLRDSVWVDGS
jgi:peptidoglycan/LPS O-acetylase OafA/YrhL